MKTIKELREANASLELRMQELLDKPTMTAEESAQYAKMEREHKLNVTKIQQLAAEKQVRSLQTPVQKTLVAQLREALKTENRTITVQGYTPSGQSKVDGVHDDIIETEIQGILEPLYANSVLSKLGVRWYKGMPQGDIQVPVMGKGTVGWAGEIAAASASQNTFTNIKLSPKRLTAYVDISKQLILQDNAGAEEAIRRDLVNAVADKLEETIFGSAAGTTDKPAGMFNGKTPTDASDFAKICALEATVEDANVTGEMKYLLSTGAKADLRAMAKSTKNTQLVMEGGAVDGTPVITTSNVKTAGTFIYGNWANLAVASWGDVEITVDPYTQAANGCIRLVVNAFFDAKVLRSVAFAFGKTR